MKQRYQIKLKPRGNLGFIHMFLFCLAGRTNPISWKALTSPLHNSCFWDAKLDCQGGNYGQGKVLKFSLKSGACGGELKEEGK